MTEYRYGCTYELNAELERIRPLLDDAVSYQKQFPQYDIPQSYWADQFGRLYIRWCLKGGAEETLVWRYCYDEAGQVFGEEIKRNLSKKELLRGKEPNKPVVTYTGDTHRQFERIISFTKKFGTVPGDLMIILGDAGINYYGGSKDEEVKARLSKLGIDLFCIHGNHDMRPESTGLYSEKEWHGGTVYVEDKYPGLMFAKD